MNIILFPYEIHSINDTALFFVFLSLSLYIYIYVYALKFNCAQFPKFVVPSYIVAFGYCGMDAVSAGYRTYQQQQHPPSSFDQTNKTNDNNKYKQVAIATMDTLLWQCKF